MATPELVMRTDPTPAEIDFLEDRLYEFNSQATGIVDAPRVRQHLRPSGRLAFNVFHPSLTFMAQHTGPLAGVWRWGATHSLPSGGWVVQSEATRYDTVRQVVHSMHRYDVYRPEGTLERTSMPWDSE